MIKGPELEIGGLSSFKLQSDDFMPLGRYFVFASGMLLALLFLANWYLPKDFREGRKQMLTGRSSVFIQTTSGPTRS